MMLRWLVTNWLRDAAQQTVRQTLAEAAAQQRAAAEDQDATPPPPCEVAIVFALGIEAGGLADLLDHPVTTRFQTHIEHAGDLQGHRVLVVESGVGREAAGEATRAVLQLHAPRWVISTGFAGALQEDLRKGHILLAKEVGHAADDILAIRLHVDEDAVTATRGLHAGRLLTVDQLVSTRPDKEALHADHAALACDMETYAVVQACQTAGTSCMSVRVISDGLADELPPEIERLLDQTTLAAKLGAAAGAIFQRPSSVKDMWRLKEDAIKLSDRLARFLSGMIAQLPRDPGSA